MENVRSACLSSHVSATTAQVYVVYLCDSARERKAGNLSPARRGAQALWGRSREQCAEAGLAPAADAGTVA